MTPTYYKPIFCFVKQDGPELTDLVLYALTMLHHNTAMIIWENQGQFRIFSLSIIHNAWMAALSSANQKKFNQRHVAFPSLINWAQGVDITPEVVNILRAREGRDSSGGSDTEANTPAEDQAENPEL